MAVLVSRAGLTVTLALLVSVIVLVAYQLPAETSFARLRSWYALATTRSAAPSDSNRSEVCVSAIALLLSSLVFSEILIWIFPFLF